MPPYLALLRAGFCLPPVLPRARCALTAPFHPYLRESGAPGRSGSRLRWAPLLRQVRRARGGGVFSVPLSVRSPCPGVTRRTALRSSDFPLLPTLHRAVVIGSSGRLAGCDHSLSQIARGLGYVTTASEYQSGRSSRSGPLPGAASSRRSSV